MLLLLIFSRYWPVRIEFFSAEWYFNKFRFIKSKSLLRKKIILTLKRQPHKMIKHTVGFVNLALKGLKILQTYQKWECFRYKIKVWNQNKSLCYCCTWWMVWYVTKFGTYVTVCKIFSVSLVSVEFFLSGHSFRTYAKCSEKPIFPTLW